MNDLIIFGRIVEFSSDWDFPKHYRSITIVLIEKGENFIEFAALGFHVSFTKR